MAVLEIVTYPANILDKEASPVKQVDDSVKKIIADMVDTMYSNMGVGLAAVQVGYDGRIIIYDVSEEREQRDYHVIINPEIVEAQGTFISEKEGCLSVPEFRTDVKRYEQVTVEGLDADGKPLSVEVHDLEAAVLQHEIDHLNGNLILDKASTLKREMYKKKVRKWQKN